MDTKVTLIQALCILYVIISIILGFTLLYLMLARRGRRPWRTIALFRRNDDDFGIQSTLFLWIATTAVATSAWVFLLFHNSKASQAIGYATLIPAASMIVAAFGIIFTFIMGSEQNTRNARQQLYQTLEI